MRTLQRFVIIAIICLALILLLHTPVQAETLERVLTEQLRELDLDSLEETLEQIREEYGAYIPRLGAEFFRDLRLGKGLSVTQILSDMVSFLLREFSAQGVLLVKLVVLAVLSTLMRQMQNSLGGTVGNIAYSICYLVLLGIVLNSFAAAAREVSQSVETIVTFIYSLLPVLLTLLVSMGAAGSAALFHPLITIGITLINGVVANTVLPLLYFSGVLYLVNSLSDRLPVSRLASLLKDISIGVMGLIFTVFIGLTVAQGTAAGISDGVAVRTTKFAVKNFIPVVGSLFSDVFETVAGCSALIKNGVGLVGLIGVLFLCAMPALKVMVLVFIYRLAAAIVEPLGAGPIADSLGSVASVLTVIGGALITVGIMFFIFIAVLIGTGNAALSLR